MQDTRPPDNILHRLAARQAAWSDATFGTDRGPEGSLHHLIDEANECLDNPTDLSEYADCLILLLDATRRAGYTLTDLANAAWAKMDANEQRTWGEPDSRGVIHHIEPDTPDPHQ